ncbi:hypothetical protein GCM10010954_22240 [Halobacillus andaensis]|uniref:Amino acid permease n=1 Tax=Halobacillus andaensis TaxID=1176239 RepID=A0A917EY27_HALAA|nr:hypothetical protein GCM10010954_22240 [Halobacillus andaensis]
MGAILYLVMDMIVHWGVIKHLRNKVNAKVGIVAAAFILDAVVLFAFIWVKAVNDWLIVAVSLIFIIFIFAGEHMFLKKVDHPQHDH